MKGSHPLRIFHFIYDHIGNPWVGGGGAGRVYEVNKRLSERHRVTVVSGKYPGARDYREGNLEFHFAGTDRDNYVLSTFCYAFAALKWLSDRKDEADTVIEDFAPYNPVFSFLWKRDAILQVHQKEGFQHLRKYFILGIPFMLVENLYVNGFRYSIAESETGRERFGLSRNAHVISNGFDPALLDEEEGDDNYILFLGRFHINQKGLDTLAESLELIEKPVKIIIAGGGKDKEKVETIFSGLEQKGLVELVGYVTGQRKRNYIKNCSFVVMPSRYEGQPVTTIEAAALGKPIVVSDIPELRYTVDAGFGTPFRKGDAKDLSEKIKYLLSNRALRKEMGQKAKKYALRFTWDEIALQHERLYMEIAGREQFIKIEDPHSQ